ncbi:hypothetical protein [Streptomyces uncialis]|uniref:hypothetical protein n=1 Tax=Streptomyces uncialis TaxID=1048205 RepID=UPI00340E67CA
MYSTEGTITHLWETDEFGVGHGGRPGVVDASGAEPGPIRIPSSSGGSDLGEITEWWGYDGRLGDTVATHLRGSCSCGWRGTDLYPIDWAEAHRQRPHEYDTSGPESDWKQHVNDVESKLVPLPDDVAELLDRLSSRLSELSDSEPLVALRAAGIAQHDAQTFAGSAAMTVRWKGIPLTTVGIALGCDAEQAEARMRAYYRNF